MILPHRHGTRQRLHMPIEKGDVVAPLVARWVGQNHLRRIRIPSDCFGLEEHRGVQRVISACWQRKRDHRIASPQEACRNFRAALGAIVALRSTAVVASNCLAPSRRQRHPLVVIVLVHRESNSHLPHDPKTGSTPLVFSRNRRQNRATCPNHHCADKRLSKPLLQCCFHSAT